jgi:hypothetical protein
MTIATHIFPMELLTRLEFQIEPDQSVHVGDPVPKREPVPMLAHVFMRQDIFEDVKPHRLMDSLQQLIRSNNLRPSEFVKYANAMLYARHQYPAPWTKDVKLGVVVPRLQIRQDHSLPLSYSINRYDYRVDTVHENIINDVRELLQDASNNQYLHTLLEFYELLTDNERSDYMYQDLVDEIAFRSREASEAQWNGPCIAYSKLRVVIERHRPKASVDTADQLLQEVFKQTQDYVIEPLHSRVVKYLETQKP